MPLVCRQKFRFEFLGYRTQVIISNILVGLKRLSYHTTFCTEYARPSESRKDLIPFEVSGEPFLRRLKELILADLFFYFLAIPIFVIWPKIQNKFPQSFLFTWYEQKGVYSSTCVHSN